MPDHRQQIWDDIAANPAFDAVVIGGGINGISTWRELAMQGLRVLLVEKSDFCSGCSAAPSRMIHGGLRYLENGEFGLVRESLEERDALLRNAPHFVRPLPTTVPIVTTFSGLFNGAMGFLTKTARPANRGALVIKAGLSFYDLFTRRRRVMPKHQFRGRAATLARWPRLTPQLKYSATYFDAWISHPEQLGIEIIRDAMRENGAALALNYAQAERGNGGMVLQDHISGTTVEITAQAVVNATGAWLDETNDTLLDNRRNARMVGGTKGSHLIIDNADLMQALNGHMIYWENTDGRVCIMFPYLGKVLLGSTDLRVDGAGPVRCSDDELEYILESMAYVFPDIAVAPDQIVYTYSGVRPLPQSDDGFTGRISRGHFTHRLASDPPVFCMVGGKWTTFRAFGAEAADMVLAELRLGRTQSSIDKPIGGGREFHDDSAALSRKTGVSAARAAHVLDHYGSDAEAVLTACAQQEADAPLAPGCAYTANEIAYLIENEHVQHPLDVLLRRTDLAITGQLSMQVVQGVTDILARHLNWNDAEKASHLAQTLSHLETYHRVTPAMLEERDRSDKCA